jgi:hypothetical protein
MLVLALQFSKGIAGQNTAVAAERELVPGEKGDPRGADSLKTEEKTRSIDLKSRGERILNTRVQTDKPTNAPTGNWFEPGQTNVDHRLNSAP